MDFVIRTIRTLFFSLDKVIYGLIDDVYGLMLQLARTSVFSTDAINLFAQRIYALIGLFMLFKISVSLVNYVINPDDFSDKEKGFSQIVKRIILSLVMIVLMPYVFTEAYELQAIILEENTIMNLVFGTPASTSDSEISSQVYTEVAGQKIQFTIMYAFAQPNYEEYTGDENYDLVDCTVAYDTDATGKYRFRTIGSGTTELVPGNTRQESAFIYELSPSCWGVYDSEHDVYVTQDNCTSQGYTCGSLLGLFRDNNVEYLYQQYAQGVAQQNFNMFFKKDIILARENGEAGKEETWRYFIDYKMGISTAVGVAVLYLFLIFCIDIAIRSIKLGFLQMVAPIPILSYCDPKSSKDGMFQRWVKMCTTTYLDLFFRLAALYFGIYVISLVGTFRDVVTGNTVSGWLVSTFMIVGILIFVKKLPDIIKDIFNIKGEGKFTLNPMKRLGDEAFGGKQIMGVGKRAVGLGVGAAAIGAGLATGQGIHRAGVGKALGGALRGDKFGKLFSNTYGAGHQRHQQLKEAQAQGLSHWDMARSEFTGARAARAQSAYQNLDNQIKAFESGATKEDKVLDELTKRKEAAHVQGNHSLEAKFDEAIKIRKNHVYTTKTVLSDEKSAGLKKVTEMSDNELMGLSKSKLGATAASEGLTSRIDNVGSAVSTVNSSVSSSYQVADSSFTEIAKQASIQSGHFAADKDKTIRAAQMSGKGGKK